MEKIKSKFKNPLVVIFLTIFVDLIGVGILIPVFPQLFVNPANAFYLNPAGANISEKITNGLIILGFLTASYPLAQFLAAPILGQLSDKFGRRKILAISLAGTSISYIIFAIGIINRDLTLLFLSRIFDGITGGNISVAQAAIADITTPENRAKNFGLIGAAFGLGFVLGPYIGGKLADSGLVSWFNVTTPFWFAAILAFVNVLSVLFFFPETDDHQDPDKKINWGKSVVNIVHAFQLKGMRPLFATNFLFWAGFSFFTTFFGVYLLRQFGFNETNTGDFFAYLGVWIAFTQAVIVRRLATKFREDYILNLSILLAGFVVSLYILPNQWWQLLLIAPVFAIFNGLTQANLPALISKSADAKIQGEVLGINTSIQALAQAIPPILNGYFAAKISTEAPVMIAAAVIVISGLSFIAFYNFKDKALKKNNSEQPMVITE